VKPLRANVLTPEPWSWAGPRVLIEHEDEAQGLALASTLREAGYAVAVCPGPAEAEKCPLTGPEGCAAAHGADVVVSSLGFDRAEAAAVLQALRTSCPDVPLVVEVDPAREGAWADLLRGCELVDAPATPDQIRSAVDRALERTDGHA
jgi:DNA-binding NtrC family response regulator